MVTELVRFNCHVLKHNKHPIGTTPEALLIKYQNDTNDLVFENTKVEVVSCQWASGKTSILTKVKKVD